MSALEQSKLMDHGSGFLKDTAAIFGALMLIPRVRAHLLLLNPSWVTIFTALGAVIVGRAIDIVYKEYKVRQRRKRLFNEKTLL